MSAVVEELEAGETVGAPEDVVAQPETTVLFMSRRSELRLTWVARHQKRNLHTGADEGVSPGRAVGFKDNILRLPKVGDEVIVYDNINAGPFRAPADEVLTWLRDHPLNGDVHEGFWEVDPVAPAPSKAELTALINAATTLDLVGLDAIIEREAGGWNRSELLEIARGAKSQIQAIVTKAEHDAKAAHAAELERAAAVEAENAAKVAAAPVPPVEPNAASDVAETSADPETGQDASETES